jgi:hypothetical protein
VLAQGAERLSAEQLRRLFPPGQTIESNPQFRPRFKVELRVAGQYSGTPERAGGTSYFSTGSWWIEDSGRYCFIYRGDGLATFPECGFFYVVNGRYSTSGSEDPDALTFQRIFKQPL